MNSDCNNDCYAHSILDAQNDIGQIEVDDLYIDDCLYPDQHHQFPPPYPCPRHHVWTRISLKTDSEENWKKSKLRLNNGELAISYEIINRQKTNYRLKAGSCNKLWRDLPFIYDLPYEEYTLSSLKPQKGEESRFVLMGKSMNTHEWVEVSEEIVIKKFDPTDIYKKIDDERNRAVKVENALSNEIRKIILSGEFATSSDVSAIVEGYRYTTYSNVKAKLSNDGYALTSDIPSYEKISSVIGLSNYLKLRSDTYQSVSSDIRICGNISSVGSYVNDPNKAFYGDKSLPQVIENKVDTKYINDRVNILCGGTSEKF